MWGRDRPHPPTPFTELGQLQARVTNQTAERQTTGMTLTYTGGMSEIRHDSRAQVRERMTVTSSFSQLMSAALERRLAMATALWPHEPQRVCEGFEREQGGHPSRSLPPRSPTASQGSWS